MPDELFPSLRATLNVCARTDSIYAARSPHLGSEVDLLRHRTQYWSDDRQYWNNRRDPSFPIGDLPTTEARVELQQWPEHKKQTAPQFRYRRGDSYEAKSS